MLNSRVEEKKLTLVSMYYVCGCIYASTKGAHLRMYDVCAYVCMHVCMGRLCVYDRVCMSLYNYF